MARSRVLRTGAILALGVGVAMAAHWSGGDAIALPSYGELPAFQLTDERGAAYGREALLEHVSVVDFVFTSCTTACPRLSAEMAKLQAELRAAHLGDRVQLLSISIDPERDTPERLRALAARYTADPAVWHFLRGDEQTLRAVVVDGMKQVMDRQPDRGEVDGFTILHGTRLVVVDGRARIRGFYDAADAEAMARLRRDVAGLAHTRGARGGEEPSR